MADTNIEWTDKVWNPVTGCTQISAGCKNCYAEKMSKRLKGMGQKKYQNGFGVTCHFDALDEPLKWKKPKRIFVCSMGDLFHKDVPDEFRDKVFAVVMATSGLYDRVYPSHEYLILTKRPEVMKNYWCNGAYDRIAFVMRDDYKVLIDYTSLPISNLHLGVSVEDQATADERIPFLLQTPAAKRFVSYEPAIGPVDFELAQCTCPWPADAQQSRHLLSCPADIRRPDQQKKRWLLDQIIMGGETGPGARPLHPDWARSVRDQCAEAGVPFFFKSFGEWKTECVEGTEVDLTKLKPNQKVGAGDGHTKHTLYTRVGKKNIVHLLDGKEYRELI